MKSIIDSLVSLFSDISFDVSLLFLAAVIIPDEIITTDSMKSISKFR